MEPPGHELLARARLPVDQHRRRRRRHPRDLLAEPLHDGAVAQQRWWFGLVLLAPGQPPLGHRPTHREQELRPVRRLGQERGGSGLQALLGRELVPVARQNDDGDLEPALLEVVHQPEPVHPGHLEVEQHRVRGPEVHGVQRLERVGGALHLVPLARKDPLEDLPDPRLIVDDQHPPFHPAMVPASHRKKTSRRAPGEGEGWPRRPRRS